MPDYTQTQPASQQQYSPAASAVESMAAKAESTNKSGFQPPIQKFSADSLSHSPRLTQFRQKQAPLQRKTNNTGLPDNLKSGVENLSGYSMDDVRVHYNSSKPAQLQAHAYAQGTDIHLGPGQEKHLPHEAWHVVQQKQGRVRPTMQMKDNPSTSLRTGVNLNDDAGLEMEADVMGGKAIQLRRISLTKSLTVSSHLRQKDTGTQTEKTRVRNMALGNLRNAYPEQAGVVGDQDAIDLTRGLEFAERRAAMQQSIEENPTYMQPGAHVVGITENERGRRQQNTSLQHLNTMSQLGFIGAHLIKKEWGGADNPWNVVAWIQTAEDLWAAGFERPLEGALLRGEYGDGIPITIRVEKETDYLTRGVLLAREQAWMHQHDVPAAQLLLARTQNPLPAAVLVYEEGLEKLRNKLNTWIEEVAMSALGQSETGNVTLTSAQTGYAGLDQAINIHLDAMIPRLLAASFTVTGPKPIDARRIANTKSPFEVELREAADRFRSRQDVWQNELGNYAVAPGQPEHSRPQRTISGSARGGGKYLRLVD